MVLGNIWEKLWVQRTVPVFQLHHRTPIVEFLDLTNVASAAPAQSGNRRENASRKLQ